MNKKKLKKKFFSIITVVKNDQANIEKTIKSVLSQNFNNFEYIVIDGKSNDKTQEIINKYRKNLSYILSEKDNGIYFAMNKGLKLANGHVLLFVNSGDLLTKNALKIIYNKFKKNKNIDFVFGTVKRHYSNVTITKSGYNPLRLSFNFDFATSHSTGFFIKLLSSKKVGNFNTKYKCSADYDFYYRAIIKKKLTGIATNKNELIGIMKSGGYSSTVSFIDHLLEECSIRINNGQNILLIVIIFFNAIFKRCLKLIKNLLFNF
jgi:glycosyltransferase involved in cell wall biosynthesis